MKNPMKNFLKDEKGQGMTEYGLILGVIGVIAAVGFATFGTEIGDKLKTIPGELFNKVQTPGGS